MDAEKDLELNWLGIFSLVLTILIVLIFLGVVIVFFMALLLMDEPGGTFDFMLLFFSHFLHLFAFPLWALPLGVLDIIVSNLARKRESAIQKKIASLGNAVGIIGSITSFCLSSFAILFFMSWS